MEDNDDPAIAFNHFLRSSDHFYTLLHTPKWLTDDTEKPGELPENRTDSFTWATSPGMAGPNRRNTFAGPNHQTWQDARGKQFDSLTLQNKLDREAALALSLYALGHVLHLNQDLSQPDHVRNDEHLPWPLGKHWIEDYGKKNYLEASQKAGTLDQTFPLRARGWQSWQTAGFQKLKDFWDRGLYTGADAHALNDDTAATWPPQSPPTIKQLGLAEFSNGNFLGEDATYEDLIPSGTPPSQEYTLHYFPFPSLWTSTLFKVYVGSAVGAAPVTFRNSLVGNRLYIYKNADGKKVFKHSALTHAGANASKTVTLAKLKELVTINDDNVLQEYHSILIPKAIEYSAGILDYFFRGKLETTVTANGDGSYNLKIKNVSGQALQGGSFRLFYDNAQNLRTESTGNNFVTTWPGAGPLADQSSIDTTFIPVLAATKYILVYQGTIGTQNGQPQDPVDANIAVAVKQFPQVPDDGCLGVAGSVRIATWTKGSTGLVTATDVSAGDIASWHLSDNSAVTYDADICNPGSDYNITISAPWSSSDTSGIAWQGGNVVQLGLYIDGHLIQFDSQIVTSPPGVLQVTGTLSGGSTHHISFILGVPVAQPTGVANIFSTGAATIRPLTPP